MSNINPNCDGSHCVRADSEVRLYPTGGGANLILCRACFAYENAYRAGKRKHYQRDDWPHREWINCKPYPEE